MLPIRLDEYVGSQRGSYALSLPWLKKSMACATNGSIAIRCKPELCETPAEWSDNISVPNLDTIFKPADNITEWALVPVATDCKKCSSTGKVWIDCEPCAGSGQCACRCGDEHDCGLCKGTGKTSKQCMDCIVMLGSRQVSGHYIHLINRIPNAMWGVEAESASDGNRRAVFVKFDGGLIAVMPTEAP